MSFTFRGHKIHRRRGSAKAERSIRIILPSKDRKHNYWLISYRAQRIPDQPRLVGPMLPPLRRPSRQQVPLLLLLLLLDLAWGLRFPAQAPWAGPRSMRGRHGRAAVRLAEEDGGQSPLANFFKTNRDTPEAKANQMKWAREQMALEVPDETLEGSKIADREDLIAQYIESERAKFGREIERATAEAEVSARSASGGRPNDVRAHNADLLRPQQPAITRAHPSSAPTLSP